jgi:hypothetical protein
MNHIVARQSKTLPTTVPIGAPSAVAAVSPVVTAAMARPRCSGPISAEAVTLAAGMMPSGQVDGPECPGLQPGQRPFRCDGLDPRPGDLVFVMRDGLTGPERESEHFDPVGFQPTALVGIAERLPFERGGMVRPTAPDGSAEYVEELMRVEYVAVVRAVDLHP